MYTESVKNKEIMNLKFEGFMMYLQPISPFFCENKGLKSNFILIIF
jgi:hypothetical protein